jgi:hypothetical protein
MAGLVLMFFGNEKVFPRGTRRRKFLDSEREFVLIINMGSFAKEVRIEAESNRI